MQTVYFQQNPVHVLGTIPTAGMLAPAFELTNVDLGTVTLDTYKGKRLVLNIFPSLDTAVCAMSVRRFNTEAASLPNTTVLCVSMDLPFAAKRFCTAEGIDGVETASAFRSPDFGEKYGVALTDGPLKGLLTRAVVVIDEDGRVIYSQLVEEITTEPDYHAVVDILKS